MKASVTLKQGFGLTYTTRSGRLYKAGITETIVDPRDIADVQNNERFSVSIHEERPTIKVKAPVVVEEEEPPLGDDDASDGEEDEEAGSKTPTKRAKPAKAKV